MTKRYRYFLFSQEQFNDRTKAEAKLKKVYVPGKVMNRGRYVAFTEISASPKNIKYADAKVVAKGNLSEMRYIPSKSEWGVR